MNVKKDNNIIYLPEGFWIKDKHNKKRIDADKLSDIEKIKESILKDIKNKNLFAWLEDFKEDD